MLHAARHALWALIILSCGVRPLGAADLTAGWELLRADPFAQAPVPAEAAWQPASVLSDRAAEVQARTRPGRLLWFRRQLPTQAGSGPLVLELRPGHLVEDVTFAGQPVPSITRRWRVRNAPESVAIDRLDTDWFMSISVQRKKTFENMELEAPARYLLPESARQGGELRMRMWDFPRHQGLPEAADLRDPTLADRVVPVAWTDFAKDTATTQVGLSERCGLPLTATGAVSFNDRIGAVVGATSLSLEVPAGKEASLALNWPAGAERAFVTWSAAGASLPPQRVWRRERLTSDGPRSTLSLEGAQWHLRRIAKDEQFDPAALPTDRWRPTYVPGHQRNGEEYNETAWPHLALRCNFDLPSGFQPSAAQRSISLAIEDLRQIGTFWLNGRKLAALGFHQVPAELDLGDALRPSGNELIVLLGVQTEFAKEFLPSGSTSQIGKEPYRKDIVLGSVNLIARPTLRIDQVRITTAVADGRLRAVATIVNDGPKPVAVRWQAKVRSAQGSGPQLPPQEATVPARGSVELSSEAAADLPRWAPWSPVLHELVSTVSVANRPVDQQRERFGWRELAIRGSDVLLNGEPLHVRGGRRPPFGFRNAWDWHDVIDLAERRHADGVNFYRGMEYNFSKDYLDLMDEVGLMNSVFIGMWDNHGGNLTADPDTIRIYREACAKTVSSIANRPGTLYYEFGNELRVDDPAIRDFAGGMLQHLRTLDPSRLATSSHASDLDGTWGVANHHYGAGGSSSAKGWREPLPNAGKPTYNSEFSWQHDDLAFDDGYAWAGEIVRQFTGYRGGISWSRNWLGGMETMAWQRERWIEGFRRHDWAGCAAWTPDYIAMRAYAPLAATLREPNLRFVAGSNAARTLEIFNDRGRAFSGSVRVQLGSSRIEVPVQVAHGARLAIPIDIPVPASSAPAWLPLSTEVVENGTVLHRRPWRATVVPATWAKRPELSALLVGQIGGDAALLAPWGITPVQISTPAEFAALPPAAVLVLAPGAVAVEQLASEVQTRIRGGATALFLGRRDAGTWLGLPITVIEQGGFRGDLLAPAHLALADLHSDDLSEWAGDGDFAAFGWNPPIGYSSRVLIGSKPARAELLELPLGSGKALVSSLDFSPQRLAIEPVAARLLANLLVDAKRALTAFRPTVVVNSGGAPQSSELLRRRLGLQAEFVTAIPEHLPAGGLLVLTGFVDSSGDEDREAGTVPTAASGARLKAWIQAGGILLVQGCSAPLREWLTANLGLELVQSQVTGVMANKLLTTHPLLAGVGEGDLAWFKVLQHFAPFTGFPAGGDAKTLLKRDRAANLFRSVIEPQGSPALLWPAVLSAVNLGQGQVVFDQSRSADVKMRTSSYWNEDSRTIAQHYQTTLLTNLGAELRPPAPTPAARVVGLDFTPLDLTSALTTTRRDDIRGDGTGWIDLGKSVDLRALAAGRVTAGQVPFVIADETAPGSKGALLLRSEDHLPTLPTVSKPIPVGRAASDVFFLHALGWAGESEETEAFRYEIRYAGYSQQIPGTDMTPVHRGGRRPPPARRG